MPGVLPVLKKGVEGVKGVGGTPPAGLAEEGDAGDRMDVKGTWSAGATAGSMGVSRVSAEISWREVVQKKSAWFDLAGRSVGDSLCGPLGARFLA